MGTPSQARARFCALGLALLPIVGLDSATARARSEESGAPCVEPAGLARSVVSIAWYFDRPRHDAAGTEIRGERATAWFYTSPRLLVTAAHFAKELPAEDWLTVELRQTVPGIEPDRVARVQVRVVEQPGIHGMNTTRGTAMAQDVAVLELRDPFPNAQVLETSPDPPAEDASVLVVGYPGGTLHAVRGVVREPEETAGRFAGLSLLEVLGPDRLLLNGGTSGAPVLDCRWGHVVAVVSGLLAGPSVAAGHLVPTPAGSPTNTAVPAATLIDMAGRMLASEQRIAPERNQVLDVSGSIR